jgi:hypothetical protein
MNLRKIVFSSTFVLAVAALSPAVAQGATTSSANTGNEWHFEAS